MQKLLNRNTYTPTNTSLVCSSVTNSLNKEETPSCLGLKTFNNNLEGNQAQQTERSLKPLVFVLSKQGIPLMPCSIAKSKRLVKKEAAKVIKRFPFTIQLTFECENNIQDIALGIDSGFQNIGFSCITESKELISGTVILDNRTKERLEEKRMYRRNRRNRLWYRKKRFDNRKRKKSWLPPSIERRYQTHLNITNSLKDILPISSTTIEVGKFDIQKLGNPNIEGIEYQQGDMYQYRNRIAYLLAREKGTCQYCNKKYEKNNPWRQHHIFGKERDRPKDWALLHENCHKKLHKKNEEHLLRKEKSKSYKDSTFMNIIRKRFLKDIECELAYGNYTFQDRIELGLEKTHVNDAFVIAKGSIQERCRPYEIKQVHRNNRVLQLNRKGFKPSIKKEKSKINPGDLFWIGTKQYTCKGMFNYGKYVAYGSTKKKEYFRFKNVTKVFKFGSLIWSLN